MNQPARQTRQAPQRPQSNSQPASNNASSADGEESSPEGESVTRKRRSAEERLAEQKRKQEKKQREIEKGERKIADLMRQDQIKKLSEMIAKSDDKELKKKVRRAIECERNRGVLYDAQEVLEDLGFDTAAVVEALKQVSEASAQYMSELQQATG